MNNDICETKNINIPILNNIDSKKPVLEDDTEKSPQTNNIPVIENDNEKKEEFIPVVTKSKSSEDDIKWIFSFRFWDQVSYFGLDRTKTKWFVSLFERLKELSRFKRSDIMENYAIQKSMRYHSINWNQKNIPIKRENLTWVDKDYLNNSDEYEFFQFQISKALGRIVGFWDENLVFNIVLFDPLHNIQPSKSHSYKVDKCSNLTCEYTDLLNKISSATCLDDLKSSLDSELSSTILMHFTDETLTKDLNDLIETGKVDSPTEILYAGIEYIKDL